MAFTRRLSLLVELVGARLFEAFQAEYLAREGRIGRGAGAVTRRPAALSSGPAIFINQPARTANIRMAVRKALALALASGFFPGLNDENLGDCHIFNIHYGSKTGDIQ
jgi:hypothetical protein